MSVCLPQVSATKILFGVLKKGGNTVAQLVEALHYKPENRGFDSRWCL
jgi:hypothetical protein